MNELLIGHGMPFHLKAGLIGNLSLKYNYMSFMTNPIEILIDELFLIFGPILNPSSENFNDDPNNP